VSRFEHEHAKAEARDRAVLDRDAVVAVVGNPEVAELLRTRVDQRAVTAERVAVQIEGDVVGADHDPVVRAVEKVAVERRVGGDRLAAAGLLASGLGAAQSHEGNDREGHDHRNRDDRRAGGVEAKLG
jgi:hypothetical protein